MVLMLVKVSPWLKKIVKISILKWLKMVLNANKRFAMVEENLNKFTSETA